MISLAQAKQGESVMNKTVPWPLIKHPASEWLHPQAPGSSLSQVLGPPA